jgi:fucose permease
LLYAFTPIVADKFGRRWGITVGSITMIIGAILQCESHNFAAVVRKWFDILFGVALPGAQVVR